MTGEQRKAIEEAIADCEARASAATGEMLAQKQAARLLRQRAYALRGLLAETGLPAPVEDSAAVVDVPMLRSGA